MFWKEASLPNTGWYGENQMFSSRRSYGNQKQLFHTEVLIPEEGFWATN
jgi:hypothetical protein